MDIPMERQCSQSRASTPPPARETVLATVKIESATCGDSLEEGEAGDDICPVCYNLDPHRAPTAGHTSWAALEYDIPAATPVGRLTITKPEDLIREAEDGCIHCHIIVTALEFAYQGWAGKPSIIHVHLALGLPVVVRWDYGYMVNDLLDKDKALRQTGIELPEGPDRINASLALYYPERENIELEIYRLRPDQGQSTPTNEEPSDIAQHMGFGAPIPLHSGAVRGFDFVKQHVDQCIREHSCGGGDDGPPLLPDRVLWVGTNRASGIQLVETKGQRRARYVTLSYCWGPVSESTFLTTRRNLAARKVGIDLEDLPPLLQNVVASARALGIEFVWVDRLCILQGDDGDFAQQAPKMGEIYGRATLTIAAASASSEDERIFLQRDARWRQHVLNMDLEEMGVPKKLRLGFRRRSHRLGTERLGGDYGRSSTRAWIWQERLLSSRTVIFTPHALKFECHHHSIWEGFDQGVVGHSWSAHLDRMTHDSWLRLVQEFMRRGITKPSDRLPAMDAVVQRVTQRTGWKPVWGLWEEAIVQGLAWRSGDNTSKPHMCRANPSRCAPTWSWASLDGPVSYVGVLPTIGYMDKTDPLAYDLQCQSINAISGAMTINARCVVGCIRVTVKRSSDDKDSKSGNDSIESPDDKPTEPSSNVKYEYKVKCLYDRELLVVPDVPLMPHGGDPDREFTANVTRVPHGQAIPQQSWTGLCLCALLGSQRKLAIVLLLGIRPDRLAYERIGVAPGVFPAAFAQAERQSVLIT